MKKKLPLIYKNVVTLWIIILSTTGVIAQLPPSPVIQSPNASSLGTFGNIPVSYFTGTPDISIPIYTLSCGDIKVPIELKYHPASVKPNEHPGWVGLGWNLQSYGCITRVPHGMLDEDNAQPAVKRPYYPIDNDVNSSGSYKVTTTNWDTESYLKVYLKSILIPDKYDVCADEFYFNFLGYSGKFCYTNEGWKVISDHNIKVELDATPFILKSELEKQIHAILATYGGSTIDLDSQHQPRMFNGFTLTTEDGTQYYFGGTGAVEYGSDYYNPGGYFSINSWYLKKIKDVNGDEINFTYKTYNPVVNLAYYCKLSDYGCSRGYDWIFGLPESINFETLIASVQTKAHSGRIIWPLYLDEVSTSKNEKVSFSSSESVEKNYSDLFFSALDEEIGPFLDFTYYARIGYFSANIKWRKLDDITIKYNNTKFFGYHFSYNPSPTQRLTLESVTESDKNNLNGKVYTFGYNNIPGLPDYGGNWTDHWGYYNGTDINGTSKAVYYSNKNTSSSLVTTGLINQITYPTGGFTQFDWEANYCLNTLSLDHESLVPYNGYVGGCRIKEIRNYTSSNTSPITKKYYYVSNYSNTTYNGSSPSSGILNGVPVYSFSVNNRTCDISNDNCTISFGFFSTNGYASYMGSHIGYSEVIEKNGDASYTKYLFSNYGMDCNGKLHNDISSTYIGWKKGEDVYIPFSSLEQERGKMLGLYKFYANDKPVEKTFFRYRDDDTRFGDYIKRMDVRNVIGCSNANSLMFAAASKDFRYNYYVVQKETDQYNTDGNVTLQDITDYTYNSYNQIASEKKTNSDNSELTTNFKYPLDYADFDALPEIAQLKQKYIINPPIEKIVRKSNMIVNAEYTEYNTFPTNLIKPQKVYQLNSNSPINDNDFYCKKYTIEEENHTLWIEEGCEYSQSVTFNVDTRAQADISLHLTFPCSVCGYYTLDINGNNYKLYTGLHDDYVIDTNESLNFTSGSYTITLSYITYPGHELSPMLGSADISFRSFIGNIQYNSNLRQIASLNYNNAGEVIEIQKTDDIRTSYVWGYNQTYPVIKAENISSSDLNTAVSSIQSDLEGFLINTLDDMTTDAQKTSWKSFNTSLRSSLPGNSMITTYTYKPLTGMTSSTDPNGITIYYEYDTFGRLKWLKDEDGRILKTYEYHYKQ